MKLLTHNMLACHIKGVKNGYPFKIEANKVERVNADYDPDFLRRMYNRLKWDAFLDGARSLDCAGSLPVTVTDDTLQDEGFLQQFHHALLEVQLVEGYLVCPETGRKFPVNKGIPNLLLNENEC